jgi:N-acetylglucosamine-6-sulfatase
LRIDRRSFLGAGFGAAVGASCAAPARRDKRPNVLFILTDDQRWDCLSCAGHPFLKTPHIDRIAGEGVRFANAFVTTSLCSPSRASFLSGLYAHTHQVVNNFTDYPPNLPGYPVQLKAAGYQTAYIGKWHMGEQSDEARPGFDYWASHKGQGTYFDTTFNINGRRDVLKGYYTHRVTDLAVDWLKKPRRQPFMMILGHKAPHGTWVPEPKYEHAFDQVEIRRPATAGDTGTGKGDWVRKRVPTWHGIDGPLYGVKDYTKFVRAYLATILSVDDSVGRIYETLRAAGELDNTLLVFAGDNGFLLGEHGAIDKRTMWEESIRIPILARCPELIRTPRVIPQMALNVDLCPTVLEVCGLPPAKTHGRSWKTLFQGEDPGWRKSWSYEYNYEQEFPYTPNVRGVRTDDWKYIRYPNGPGRADLDPAELYDLKSDPLETRNLMNAPEAAGKLAELKGELARLQSETGALPDRMPLDPEMKTQLPEKSIR